MYRGYGMDIFKWHLIFHCCLLHWDLPSSATTVSATWNPGTVAFTVLVKLGAVFLKSRLSDLVESLFIPKTKTIQVEQGFFIKSVENALYAKAMYVFQNFYIK